MPALDPPWIAAALMGGLGCAARALARDLLVRRRLESWQAVLAINVLGAAAIGAFQASMPPSGTALLISSGFLAGWTTASSFSVDVALLWMRGRRLASAACWAATIVGTPCVAVAAHSLVQVLASRGGASS